MSAPAPSGPVPHAEAALIAELAGLGYRPTAIARRTGRDRSTIKLYTPRKRQAGTLSPLARLAVVRDADAGKPYARIALCYGLAPESIPVIVCRERARLKDRIGHGMEASVGLERLTDLYTGSSLGLVEIAQAIAAETGIAITAANVSKQAKAMGLRRCPDFEDERRTRQDVIVVVTLAHGYVYRNGRLARTLTTGGGDAR